jgi:ribosomal-protein-alanine N-acetyltransferase
MIRFFKKSDIDQIYELGEKLSPNFKKTNDLKEILKDKYTKILVDEEENKVVAFLMYTDLKETMDIIDIYVDENYRNQKIASCLIDYMISEADSSLKIITLEVRKNNKPAINLYEKFGFEIINTRKNYYENEDAYLMGRSI